MIAHQPSLLETTTWKWELQIRFKEYVRFRGVIIESELRQTCNATGRNEDEAKDEIRQWFQKTIADQYRALDMNIENISKAKPLWKPRSIEFKSVQHAK